MGILVGMKRSVTHHDTHRSLVKRLAGPMLLVLVMFYLGFHAVSGERGVFALFRETRKLEALQAELADVRHKHEVFDRKVHLLSDDSLDLDLLDEQVRRVSGMAGKDEIVYFTDDQAAKSK